MIEALVLRLRANGTKYIKSRHLTEKCEKSSQEIGAKLGQLDYITKWNEGSSEATWCIDTDVIECTRCQNLRPMCDVMDLTKCSNCESSELEVKP